ncbi:Porin D precursor [compost metagenome]
MRTATPVFTTADSRLLPEMATGVYLRSQALGPVHVEAGHFTAYHEFASSNRDDSLRTRYSDTQVRSLDFIGASYRLGDALGLAAELPQPQLQRAPGQRTRAEFRHPCVP